MYDLLIAAGRLILGFTFIVVVLLALIFIPYFLTAGAMYGIHLITGCGFNWTYPVIGPFLFIIFIGLMSK